ncbi:MAG: ATP-binding cassette domain-containing protein [Chitinophagaceae bacterium]|nr:MAG: ATP-binding cassette domain-containing protein [Chitinophagaceae bacterium]
MINISIRKKLMMAEGACDLVINTKIGTGELTAISGKSGAGKTSLLRMMAGFLKPESGFMKTEEEVWLDIENKIDLPVQKRNIGFVFQDPALFPNMTVKENLQYAAGKKGDKQFLNQLLEMVGLTSLADRKPAELSGGQQQRVAITRALARKPKLLLLDEPFAALDNEMRRYLREELLTLHRKFGLTTLLVTHDLSDIYYLADKVLVIDKGEIIKSGNPNQVFANNTIDGKVQLQGEVLNTYKSGVVYIVEILTGNTIMKLVVGEEEKNTLHPGMKVLVTSGAFEPVISLLS